MADTRDPTKVIGPLGKRHLGSPLPRNMSVERLLILAEDGRAFLSSQLKERAEDVSWILAGENVTCVCGSYCSQACCVMGGRLFARETGYGSSGEWRPVNVECNAVFMGRSSMVVQGSGGNAVRSSFDPFHPNCPQIGAWEVLPLLVGAPVTSCSRLLLGPRDHVMAVGDLGQVYLLRDTWVRVAPAPMGHSGEPSTPRGFLGRAKSFLQNLRRGKGRRSPAAFLGPNCLWVSSVSQPCLYRLSLGDLDSALLLKREVHDWATFPLVGGERVASLAGSIHCSDMFWGINESGHLHEYTVDNTEGEMCVRPRLVSVVLEEGETVPPLVDVCIVSEVLGSPFQSAISTSRSVEEFGQVDSEGEEFVEAQGVNSLPGLQKLAFRYCCDEGDCDACSSMSAFRTTLPSFLPALPGEEETISMPEHSSAETILQWRKRPDPLPLATVPGSSRKRQKTVQLLGR